MHEKGVYRLKHILENNGELKSDRYFAKFGLEVNEIYPNIYPNIPREEENNVNISETDFSVGGQIINISNLRSKQIYLQLLKKEKSESPVFDRIKRNYDLFFVQGDL